MGRVCHGRSPIVTAPLAGGNGRPAGRAIVHPPEGAGTEGIIQAQNQRYWQVFFEIHSNLPREAPGDEPSARRALLALKELPPDPLVLDLGCGPGSATTLLARETGGRVVGLDRHAPFVREVRPRAHGDGLEERVHAVIGDMTMLPFAPRTFDLVWSEGALYSVGFDRGLRIARDQLRAGGCLVATEAVWLEAEPPDEIRRWWEGEYPDISSVEARLEVIAGAGLATLDHFTLPGGAWEEYYRPLERRIEELRKRHTGDPFALGVLDEARVEIDMWRRFGGSYGYELFVCRRPEDPTPTRHGPV
jgi:SAM-dependent methyltransferase